MYKYFPYALSLLARHSRATAATPFEDPDAFHGGAIAVLVKAFAFEQTVFMSP